MGLFRNGEIRRFLCIAGCLSFLAVIGGFLIDPAAGVLVLCLCLLLMLLWLWDTSRRYRDFARLAEEIDCILHKEELRPLSHYQEGELSLLESEIAKLLTRLQEQADLLQKDKTYLADSMADISHQLRTSLTTIHLALSSMGEGDLSPEKEASSRMEVSRQLSRMDWLISSLLKLSKLDARAVQFRPTRLSIEELVRKAADPLSISMELKGQTLALDLSGSVRCDPAWTAEAVGNILKNCTEHMEEGTLFVTSVENTLYSQLVIRDTGPGIDPEDLPHLFERFYRGKNAAPESVGIGLALSRSILAAQNGTVKARNHPEGGAEFTIRFYKSTI